jgi:hypothetical protein
VPLYLLIDPLLTEETLFSKPRGKQYRTKSTGQFGEKLPFPEPFGGVLDTSIFIP